MEIKEIQEIKKDTSPLVGLANNINVTNETDAESASQFVKKVSDKIKEIEEKRLSFTKPLNESLNAINTTFRELSIPLASAKTIVANKIISWRRMEQERIEKEEARRRAIQEAHAEQGHKVNAPIVMEKPKTTIANMQIRKIWKFEVTDISKIPTEYLQINSFAVTTAIREGKREIPGIKIYQEEISAIR